MMDGMMNGGVWLWMLLPLLFWGGLIAFAVWALIKVFPNRGGGGNSGSHEDSAEDILRKRFARGEIDTDEYERSLEVLKDREKSTKGGI